MKRLSTLTLSLLGTAALAVAIIFGGMFAQPVAAQDATPAPMVSAGILCPSSTVALILVAEDAYGYVAPVDLAQYNLGVYAPAFMAHMSMMATAEASMEAAPMTRMTCAQLLRDVNSFLYGHFNISTGTSAAPSATEEPTNIVTYSVQMSGPEEIPGPGDPDAVGNATVTLRPDTTQICWTINVGGINLPAAAAHIHRGAVGESGSVVVPLTAPDGGGVSSGCATAEADLINEIMMNPSGFYVNVHNADFPDGAVRGNLQG